MIVPRRSNNRLGGQALRRRVRAGMAAIEVVMAAGITLPIVGFVFYCGLQACRVLFCVIGTMIGSAYM